MAGLLIASLATGIAAIGAMASVDIANIKKGTSTHKMLHEDWYQGEFPQEQFQPSKKNRKDFYEKVATGREVAAKKRIVLVGLARNVAKFIPATVANMRTIGELFFDYRVLMFENDSEDGTREVIKAEFASNPKMTLIECTGIVDCKFGEKGAVEHGLVSPSRMEKMAKYRNVCLEMAKQLYPQFDYLMVMDTDLNGPMSMDGLVHCFAYHGWDAMAANGLVARPLTLGQGLYHYDTLAWLGLNESPSLSPKKVIPRHIMKVLFSKTLKTGNDPVQVRSAFSGACIYNMEVLRRTDAHYNGQFCEHVALHLEMESKGAYRIFMNPSFIILHTSRDPVPRRTKNKKPKNAI